MSDEPHKTVFLRDPKQAADCMFRLTQWACEHLQAGAQFQVTVRVMKRTDPQNRKFHAQCLDLSRQLEWAGKKRTQANWKVLTVSGHSIATGEGAEMLPGLESEFVNLRESTANMSVKRGASLISYVDALGAMRGVKWSEPAADD